MKKLFFVVLIGLGFMSCEKDFSCDCTTTTTTTTDEWDPFFEEWNTTTTTSTSESSYLFTAKKDEAASVCNSYESNTETMDGSVVTNCSHRSF